MKDNLDGSPLFVVPSVDCTRCEVVPSTEQLQNLLIKLPIPNIHPSLRVQKEPLHPLALVLHEAPVRRDVEDAVGLILRVLLFELVFTLLKDPLFGTEIEDLLGAEPTLVVLERGE